MFDTCVLIRQGCDHVIERLPDREEPIVGQKTVRFSDLSGQLITEDDALARIVVHDHPELGDSPVEFEALTDEAKVIEKAALRVAIVELHVPGEDEPRRVVVDAATFDALATDTPMNELLITARPARPARRAAKTTSGAASSTSNSTGHSTGHSGGNSGGGRVNYATLEHAGEPHKGKTTDLEKQLVRDHFDGINDRLVAQGLRTISLADPEHIERYGLQDLASELMPGQEALPIKELISERDEDLPLDDIQDDLAS